MAGVLSGGEQYVRLRLVGEPGEGGEITGTSFHFREAWGYDVFAIFDLTEPADVAVVRFTMTYVDFPLPNQEILEVHVYRLPEYSTSITCWSPSVVHGESTTMSFVASHWCAGSCSFPHTFTATLVRGQELGVLVDPLSGQRGTTVTGILPQNLGGGRLSFEASGTEPAFLGTVVVRISASAASILPAQQTLWVTPAPSCPLVALTPDTLATGDTAVVGVLRRNSDGTVGPYPPGTLLSIRISEGQEYSTLAWPGGPDTADSFDRIGLDGVQLIVTADVVEDSVQVVLRASVVAATDGSGEQTSGVEPRKGDAPEPFPSRGSFDAEAVECYVARAVILPERHTILVGETKYYQARPHPRFPGKLIIDELAAPELNGGIPEDVWGESPVLDPGGDSAFVYWEKKFPVYSERDSFLRMEALPQGLMRLIGRRNRPGAENEITLTANTGGRSGRIQVQVKRPRLLGTSAFARQRSRGLDHEGAFYDVDSLCIWWGSLSGISPQLVKAQYECESFYDPTLAAYVPSYRYEPWTTQFDAALTEAFENGPFWVTEMAMGSGVSVPSHPVTRYMQYATAPTTVWQILEHYTNLVFNPPPYGGPSLFGVRQLSDNLLRFKYSLPARHYKVIRSRVYRTRGIPPSQQDPQANLEAANRFLEFVRFQLFDGLQNIVAQTRVASSYGPLQLMYSTAADRGYGQSPQDAPELLNNPTIFMELAVGNLQVTLDVVTAHQGASNWVVGWEPAFLQVYFAWNQKPEYNDAVLRYGKLFSPAR
jgi:hypothetical protein